jgi:hypothetical protein
MPLISGGLQERRVSILRRPRPAPLKCIRGEHLSTVRVWFLVARAALAMQLERAASCGAE